MVPIDQAPEPNIWKNICKEFAHARGEPFTEPAVAVQKEEEHGQYDPCLLSPVFGGLKHRTVASLAEWFCEFDSSIVHPACMGYEFVQPEEEVLDKKPVEKRPAKPEKLTCTAEDFLKHYIFPVLLPALEAMMRMAQEKKCFEELKFP